MEMNVRMPANYNLMTEDEMTYTTGGSTAGDVAATVTSAAILGVWIAGAVNWVSMLMGAHNWYGANKTGDVGTDVENAANAWLDYTTSSVWNGIRSVWGTLWCVGTPVGWIGTAIAILTA